MAEIILSKLDLIEDMKREISKYFTCDCCGRISNLKKVGYYYQCLGCTYRVIRGHMRGDVYTCWLGEKGRSFIETRMYVNETVIAVRYFRYDIKGDKGIVYVPIDIIKDKNKFLIMCSDYSFSIVESKKFACVVFAYAEPVFSEYQGGYVDFVHKFYDRLESKKKVRYYSFCRAAAIILTKGLRIDKN